MLSSVIDKELNKAAVEFIAKYKVDYAVIGASSIDVDGSILDFDSREVAGCHDLKPRWGIPSVTKINPHHHHSCILVADQSKFERNAPCKRT